MKFKLKPMTAVLIGAIIAIVGGLISAFGTWKENMNSSKQSTRIEMGVDTTVGIGKSTNDKVQQLEKQNTNLEEKISKQIVTIDQLRKENTELYSKLASASLDIYNNLTGGDSYCQMDITNISANKDFAYIGFHVEGKYPLNQIQVRMVDLNTFGTQDMTMENINKNVFDVGTLNPGGELITQQILQLDKIKGVNLNLFFHANNGYTIQSIKMKFVNNSWTSANIITSMLNGKILFKKIDPSYPQ